MRFLFLSLFLFLSASTVQAQLSLQNNVQANIDFDNTLPNVNAGTFSSQGIHTSPSTGQLDANAWSMTGLSDGFQDFGINKTTGDFARGNSNGGASTGGIYAFNVGSTGRALGIQPTGSDFTPGSISLKVENTGTTSINQIAISYQLFVRNDQARSSTFNLSWSNDNQSFQTLTSTNFTSPVAADAAPQWTAYNFSETVPNLTILPGDFIYFKWSSSDGAGSGSRDELALDNIVLSANTASNSCTEPTSIPNNLSFGTITSSSILGSFNPSIADKYLVLTSTSSSLSTLPTDGTFYAVGNTIGNAEVIQYNSSTSISAFGLTENTTYYFYIFAANDNCAGGPEFLTSAYLTGSTSTPSGSGNNNYYSSIGTESCADLKTNLSNLVDNHTVVSYGSLWTHYQTSDDHLNDSGTETIVWDMYSDNPNGIENEFTFVAEQCGTYSGEGSCYNREHSFPKSWWGGSTSIPAYTDMFLVIPVDGWINGIRSNVPYSEVIPGTETYTTNNGTKKGNSAISMTGYSGSVFEPIDAYKGDLARGYFYFATRYENEIGGWQNSTPESAAVLDGTSFPVFNPWKLDLLISWHNADPVSQKEIDRNESIYSIQGNRNPFIDHPEYVNRIWGDCNAPIDTAAPSTPTNLTASNITENSVDLSWTNSTDNVGVTGYKIYQNGLFIASSNANTFGVNNLTAGTTVSFSVTAIDAAGNESSNSNTVTITTPYTAGPIVLSESYFESSWDGWTDGGSDCARYRGSNSSEGSYSIRIRDNSGTASAMTSPVFDLIGYTSATIDFSFYAYSMENNEDFWLRYFDGNTWITIGDYNAGSTFQNGNFYTESVTIDLAAYNFPTNAQFRFQCDASGNKDQIFIDEVVITANGNSGLLRTVPEVESIKEEPVVPRAFANLPSKVIDQTTLFPNPAYEILHVKLASEDGTRSMDVFDASGRKVKTVALLGTKEYSIDIAGLENGVYYLSIIKKDGQRNMMKFIVQQ